MRRVLGSEFEGIRIAEHPLLRIDLSREHGCEGMSNAELRSAARADRFDDRTDANVAVASTSVPVAVASAEIVTQSAIAARYAIAAPMVGAVRWTRSRRNMSDFS